MGRRETLSWSSGLAAALLALLAPVAQAAAPANDDRSRAEAITVPATANGTVVEATVERSDPATCGSSAGSVWYRYRADRARRVVVDLAANGDLDAIVDVFRQRRSQLDPLDCEATDDGGAASIAFQAQRGQAYLIRVVRRAGSEPGTFRLTTSAVQPPATPPGRALATAGARDSVNRTLNPSDAWNVRLRAGTSYRVNIAGSDCVRGEIYAPGARSFDDEDPVRVAACGGYGLFTPNPDEGGSGRYVIRVLATRRGTTPYRLTVAPATSDDTAPGRPLLNFSPTRGSLDGGGIDALDLYRFDIRRRSDLVLDLRTGGSFDLQLLSDTGRRVGCACGEDGDVQLRTPLRRGRYFAAVRARGTSRGSYRLSRITRGITSTRLRVDPRAVRPGGLVTLAAAISGGASGKTLIGVERFDPLEGWQFYARYEVRASGGRAAIRFGVPAVGRWRARARFLGSRAFSPSESRFVGFGAQTPIGT